MHCLSDARVSLTDEAWGAGLHIFREGKVDGYHACYFGYRVYPYDFSDPCVFRDTEHL